MPLRASVFLYLEISERHGIRFRACDMVPVRNFSLLIHNFLLDPRKGCHTMMPRHIQSLLPPYPIRYVTTFAIAAIGTNIIASVNDEEESSPYSGTYRSRDDGRTWDSINYFPKVTGSIINYAGKLYASIDSSVYRSDDSGSTWKPIINSPNGEWVGSLFPTGVSIFATLSNNHIVRSEDTFKTWAFVDSSIISTPPNIYVDGSHMIASNQNIIAGTPRGIFISPDMGSSWVPSNQGLPSSVGAITCTDSQIFASNSMGVFRCGVDSAEWSDRSHAIDSINDPTMNFSALASNGNRLYIGSGYGAIWESPDQGLRWVVAKGNVDGGVNAFFVKDSLVLCAIGSGIFPFHR